MRPICMRRGPISSAPTAAAPRDICGPRRNSPARSCWRRAKAKIFEFARVFRDRERGDLHLPEFTMLEWYRADAAYDAIMADTVVVIAHAAQATGIRSFSLSRQGLRPLCRAGTVDGRGRLRALCRRRPARHDQGGEGDRGRWRRRPQGKVRVSEDDTWSDIFSKLLVEHVEPNLGQGRLTVLFEYPLPRRRWRGRKPPIRAWPSGSRSMPAASSSPTALAS